MITYLIIACCCTESRFSKMASSISGGKELISVGAEVEDVGTTTMSVSAKGMTLSGCSPFNVRCVIFLILAMRCLNIRCFAFDGHFLIPVMWYLIAPCLRLDGKSIMIRRSNAGSNRTALENFKRGCSLRNMCLTNNTSEKGEFRTEMHAKSVSDCCC